MSCPDEWRFAGCWTRNRPGRRKRKYVFSEGNCAEPLSATHFPPEGPAYRSITRSSAPLQTLQNGTSSRVNITQSICGR
jgi:hypothetical protein